MRDGACHPDAAGRNSVRVRLIAGSETGVEECVTCCSRGTAGCPVARIAPQRVNGARPRGGCQRTLDIVPSRSGAEGFAR